MKSIGFFTGSRADFGKLLPLISATADSFDITVYIGGLHLYAEYGNTYKDVINQIPSNVVYALLPKQLQSKADQQALMTAWVCDQLVQDFLALEKQHDIFVVHGDRPEALGAAIAAALSSIRVIHIEGGEISGTIDESIRHAVSKLSHVHCVSNEDAKDRLCAMGEEPERIYVIGSPEIDLMAQSLLKTTENCLAKHTNLNPNKPYAIMIFHPVVTDSMETYSGIDSIVSTMLHLPYQWIVINPNNDPGHDVIRDKINLIKKTQDIFVIDNIPPDDFYRLLAHSSFILGNSSAGVREAPVLGIPVINVGTRQNGRAQNPMICNVSPNMNPILEAIEQVSLQEHVPIMQFGQPGSSNKFLEILNGEDIWELPLQKTWTHY